MKTINSEKLVFQEYCIYMLLIAKKANLSYKILRQIIQLQKSIPNRNRIEMEVAKIEILKIYQEIDVVNRINPNL
jgi:hypothetical protein